MNQLIISEINIYPIKSLSGVSLPKAKVEERGLEFDRRWMLVDENNVFLSQRRFPEMSLINVELLEDGLKISHKFKNFDPLFILYDDYVEDEVEVKIWDDVCPALPVSNTADCWFSKALNTPCKLVYMHDSSKRMVDKKYTSDSKMVGFADGYPFLLIGQSSLDDLNSKLITPVPMNRFRPNIVFKGGEPFEEDNIKTFKINEIKFSAVKPCARCSITTVNQETSGTGTEPLLTLSKYRKFDNKVLFGQNLVHEGSGIICIGDEIEIL